MSSFAWKGFVTVAAYGLIVTPLQPLMLVACHSQVGEQRHLGPATDLVTERNKPFTANGFGNRFRKWCDEAGLAHCSAHGLRKAGATIAAEGGATEHQLMSIFGWESPKQAALYTRKVNRHRLAAQAMHLLVPKTVPFSRDGVGSGTLSGKKPS